MPDRNGSQLSQCLLLLAVSVAFDEQVVGQGGAGYAWPPPQDPRDMRSLSIAYPPIEDAYDWPSDSDEGSVTEREAEHIEAAAIDPEVSYCLDITGLAVLHHVNPQHRCSECLHLFDRS